jgi:hypothetical protein
LSSTSAAVILGAIGLISLSVTVLLVAQAFRQALATLSRANERTELRHQQHLDTVLDRLMTIKWEDYAAVRTIDEDQVGGFFPQGSGEDDEGETEIITPTWGHLHKTSERLRASAEEAILIDEDFDETGSPRKQAPE